MKCLTLSSTESFTAVVIEMSSDTLLLRSRCPLESIVQIEVAAAHDCPQAGRHVCRQKQQTPAFVLGDVYSLVGPAPLQRVTVAAQDDVSKGDRGHTAGDNGQVGQRPSN